jgi:hypothetical protein
MPHRTKFGIQCWDHFELLDETCTTVKVYAFEVAILVSHLAKKTGKNKTYKGDLAGYPK